MKTKTAYFLVEQLSPIFKKSTSIIRKLKVDEDNEDIEMINMFNATLYRVNYSSRNMFQVTREITENAMMLL